ncbi:MAG: hypothetical protein IJ735_00780 [Clostridia bacterium]|nr:hypothetical protein [Clostridia bacterium]
MRKKLFVLLALTLVLTLISSCTNGEEEGPEKPYEVPYTDISEYLGTLTDVTIEYVVDFGEGDKIALVVKVSGDYATVDQIYGRESVTNAYVKSGDYDCAYLIDGQESVLCERRATTGPSYNAYYFVDLIDASLREFDLLESFSVAECGRFSAQDVTFSYQKEGVKVTGGTSDVGKTSPTRYEVAFVDFVERDVQSATDLGLYVFAERAGRVSVGLRFVFEDGFGVLDLLYFDAGVWDRQKNFLVKEKDRLYFYSADEGWQYTDLAQDFLPGPVVKTVTDLLLNAEGFDLTQALDGGVLCRVEGEEATLYAYTFAEEEEFARPQELDSSKEGAERLVRYED